MASIPPREDFNSARVRLVASRCDDADQARRLLSIAAGYDRMSRTEAARDVSMEKEHAVQAVAKAVDKMDLGRELETLDKILPLLAGAETKTHGFGWQTEEGWQ